MSDDAAPPRLPSHAPKLGDRSLFPKLRARVYANHAGVAPASVAVTTAVRQLCDDYEERGVGAVGSWVRQRLRLRGKLGTLVGARAADIALVPNTTRGVVDIALCLPWRTGERVVTFAGEFPANVTPWQRAASLFGLELVMLPADEHRVAPEAALERLLGELRRGVRLVAVSAVEFQTGLRMPLGELAACCHAHGAELFVDAVQACGIVPLDVGAEGIDYLACGAHKWLMGLEGAGFLYARPECAAALRPVVAGWLSHEDALGFLFRGPGLLRYDRPLRQSIDFVESGNTNGVGFAALEASLDLLLELGVPAIHAHVSTYLDALEAGLVERGFRSLRSAEPAGRSGALGVTPPAGTSVVDLHAALVERGIACAVPDGVLRFSPHWPNALDEVPVVLAAVDAALRR
ncbi:MAG: aminotransferase class V-fold PLP-dependent enzyme [Myxococcales bacterium]|nr:aminotransferase class V-fold PLP-dependent enzyme [Myxococcales bacterium]